MGLVKAREIVHDAALYRMYEARPLTSGIEEEPYAE